MPMLSYKRQIEIKKSAEKAHQTIMGPNVDNENLATYFKSAGLAVINADLSDLAATAYTLYNMDKDQPQIVVENALNHRDWIYMLAKELGQLILGWDYQVNQDNPQVIERVRQESNQVDDIDILDYPFSDGSCQLSTSNPTEAEADLFAEYFLVPDATAQPILQDLDWQTLSMARLIQKFSLIYFINDHIARNRLTTLIQEVSQSK
jgi:Zn-dependent peptidase ImmA (M78 family)